MIKFGFYFEDGDSRSSRLKLCGVGDKGVKMSTMTQVFVLSNGRATFFFTIY